MMHGLALVTEPDCMEVAEAVANFFKDARNRVRCAAVDTMFHVCSRGDSGMTEVLMHYLEDDEVDARLAALQSLYHVAADGDIAVISRVCECLHDDDLRIRHAAERVLTCIEL